MLASIDEIAHVLAARADRGAQHLKDAEKMLLKLFSAGSRDHITRMKAGGVTRVVPNPALNLMGFAVPDKLGKPAMLAAESITEVLDGALAA